MTKQKGKWCKNPQCLTEISLNATDFCSEHQPTPPQESECNHEFRFSHIEYPPAGTYSVIPPDKEVVICPHCGELRKTIKI